MPENKDSHEGPDLDAAYALKTPEDSVRLYRDWAASYDSDFASSMDYRLPQAVADAFAAAGGAGPVLDVGAGTGLLAEGLARHGIGPVDALDISAEMLETARGKGFYRELMQADLTQGLSIADDSYGGITSSGTFTHGHVGPEALDELMRIARPGARFALSINAAVYREAGFAAKLDSLGGALRDLRLEEVPIYGAAADPAHRGDTALVALFVKA
ncbi:class I SAM-dependent DNA methyltransferase [Acidimangrovimonas pyrenivorans]|uniref:Class I SAM-dependent DNA methyltransferase n=1 Tax=Acidimangrovimonas pyrenivorans TaxID=2030798 RepID=A0ABV7AK91_9RHOB